MNESNQPSLTKVLTTQSSQPPKPDVSQMEYMFQKCPDEGIICESDRDQLNKQRQDRYGNLIKKGSKKHKIIFNDELFSIKYYDPFPCRNNKSTQKEFNQKCCSIQ